MILVKIIKTLVFKIRYKSIWDIKQDLLYKYDAYLFNYYTAILAKAGSYIGLKSEIKSIPVFPHGLNGIFISGGAIIGKNCVIFQQVTIGSNTLSGSNEGAPVLGDNVYIGAGAKIIGNVKIGDNCRIGANAVVFNDLLDNSVAVCAPTRIIQKKDLDNRYYTKKDEIWHYYDDNKWIKDLNKL